MNKSILILGGSRLQVPAILAAKKLGLYVYVADYDKNAVGFQYADKALNTSTLDSEAVYRAMIEHNIKYLTTSTSDAPVRVVAEVLERLGRPVDISEKDAICATNKAAMRTRLKKYDIPIPKFSIINSLDEFISAAELYKYDCVSKPADNAGSRGVILINEYDKKSLAEIYEYTRKYARNNIVLMEERIKGPEVSVESITINKETYVITITDKMKTPPPYFVEIGHSEPSCLLADIKDKIIDITRRTVSAIGIKNGGSHTEIIVTENGPKVVEMAARLGGDFITSQLVLLSTGVDMVTATIKQVVGLPVDIEKKRNNGSAIRFLFTEHGVILGIEGVENAMAVNGVVDVQIYCKIGDSVNELHSSNDRIGHVITVADTAQEANSICEYALSLIHIQIK